MQPATSNCTPVAYDFLQPEMLTYKRWTAESPYSFHAQTSFFWTKCILLISLPYRGTYPHQFKAYLLDTSANGGASYALLLEDQCKGDSCQSLQCGDIAIDLQNLPPKAPLTLYLLKGLHACRIASFTPSA